MSLSLEFLQVTKSLVEMCEQSEFDSITTLQERRKELLFAIDHEGQEHYPRDVLVSCRNLLSEAQALEQQAVITLQQQREDAGEAFQKLKAADKARKAYDRFR